MLVIPAIDVLSGQVVRLRRGIRSETTFYGDLEETIAGYQDAGIKRIHIVDLTAAFGEKSDLLPRLRPFSGIKFQVGGGFRSLDKINRTLQETDYDLVVGSLLTSGDLDLLSKFETTRIIAALDVLPQEKEFIIQDNGWKRDTKKNIMGMIEDLRELSFQRFLVTDISRDGELTGPNFDLYQVLQRQFPEVKITASGGVKSVQDFSRLEERNIDSVVVGKALFEKQISLAEVLPWQQ